MRHRCVQTYHGSHSTNERSTLVSVYIRIPLDWMIDFSGRSHVKAHFIYMQIFLRYKIFSFLIIMWWRENKKLFFPLPSEQRMRNKSHGVLGDRIRGFGTECHPSCSRILLKGDNHHGGAVGNPQFPQRLLEKSRVTVAFVQQA
jgi:hypothetical protein